MWYVIRTFTGKEHEICLWINTCVEKRLYQRCFVPLYEDVARREGIGHIFIRKMFDGYVFVETEDPAGMVEALKRMPMYTAFLSVIEEEERLFLPVKPEEEAFLNSILTDGMMRVSYVRLDQHSRVKEAIGPLERYIDAIVKVDKHHRRALVKLPLFGEERTIRFCLWLDTDPKLELIEAEKRRRKENLQTTLYKAGDYILDTTGTFGDLPMEVGEVYPEKNCLKVKAPMFGSFIDVEISMDDVVLTRP